MIKVENKSRKDAELHLIDVSLRLFLFYMMKYYDSGYVADRNLLLIDHCREGRMEYTAARNSFAYIGAGDMKLDRRKFHTGIFQFPSCHYHGLTIAMTLDIVRTSLASEIKNFPVTPERIIDRFQIEEYPKVINYDITFENVDFGYDSRKILKNVSFHIPEKTSTAIVGLSGSGKTTICSLLARFYDPQSGHIFMGGHDLKEFTCDSLLSNISMVFQNVYLFHDTIRANICFGRPQATKEEMIEAAKKACCHDFIMALPKGYDTIIGEGGGTLSGGEKQRISIARAMLKDAPVIILDEATASIDPENEHLIQQAISELTRGKTIITIAHRLATIQQADQILVVDDRILNCTYLPETKSEIDTPITKYYNILYGFNSIVLYARLSKIR